MDGFCEAKSVFVCVVGFVIFLDCFVVPPRKDGRDDVDCFVIPLRSIPRNTH
ncbi:MAG: hypothetical protein PHX25_02575 [Candidatus Pacebacteria bacterium]|nr:hypothetical protein [Candidatus Paceibacterota bacterium]